MNIEITVPPTADGALQVTLVDWIKKVGDSVGKGEDLAEATTEKITLYITASADGILKEIRVKPGKKVSVGSVIGVIESA